MYRKMSRVFYLNILVVIVVGYLHEGPLAIPKLYIIYSLLFYALLNGVYFQKELVNQKKLMDGLNSERILSNTILESIPTAIVIINPDGTIKYVNKSVGKILGSMDTVGQCILDFDTIIQSGLSKKIEVGIEGEESRIDEINYQSFTSGAELILDVSIKPFKYIGRVKKHEVMMLLNDITEEKHLKTKVENQYIEMFKSFAKFIDAKDTYTGQHSSNVAKCVEKMIEFLDISDQEKHDIRIAAALHDIGKIGISETILNKPGKLTENEYNKMKLHPSIGSDLLAEINDYEEISSIIRHHHERWDGKGYPDGLKGEGIPLGSNIIAIVDAYDAITSNRVYRNARKTERAIDIIKNERWKQFNGDLVDLFLSKATRYNDTEVAVEDCIG